MPLMDMPNQLGRKTITLSDHTLKYLLRDLQIPGDAKLRGVRYYEYQGVGHVDLEIESDEYYRERQSWTSRVSG